MMLKNKVFVALSAFAMIGAGIAAPALAQQTRQVQFEEGSGAATITGTVGVNDYIDYIVSLSEAETLDVALTSGDVSFEVLSPDGNSVHNNATDGDEASISPTEGGNYRIRVYLPAGSSRATQFAIDVSAY